MNNDPVPGAQAPGIRPDSGPPAFPTMVSMTDPTSLPTAPRTISRDQHAISRKDISPSALRVLYRLHEAGYGAYLVGGAVRDLLPGEHP